MNTNLVNIVKQIIVDNGESVLADPQRLKAFFSDLAKDEPKPLRIAFGRCIEEGAYNAFKSAADAAEWAERKAEIAQRVRDEHGLDVALCAEALDVLEAAIFADKKEPPLCASCGKELQPEWKACPFCGAAMGAGAGVLAKTAPSPRIPVTQISANNSSVKLSIRKKLPLIALLIIVATATALAVAGYYQKNVTIAETQRNAEAEHQAAAETERNAEAERQATETEAERNAEAERQAAAAENQRKAEAERQAAAAENQRKAEAERQAAVAEAERKAEAERQAAATEAERKAEAERQAAVAETQRKAEAERQVAPAPAPPPVRQQPADMVRINGGTFMMGSPSTEPGRYDNEAQHSVTVSSFYMGNYEVTQREWQDVMRNNPSWFKGDNLPVENVSWYDVVEYCNKRSAMEGLTPVYTINKNRKDPNNTAPATGGKEWANDTIRWLVTWNRNANGYRLPTEAEWEYACRAGTTTPFSTGNNITTAQANYNGDYPYNGNAKGTYREETMPVGSFPANPWGLYDMHGNVMEWCWDWFGLYSSGAQTNPSGAGSGSYRVRRGGSLIDNAEDIRSADRLYSAPAYRILTLGFRLARNGGN